ncbi:CD3324 family protein [Peribacillus kribbensis]|uniref:CD3324 family protein n=1 Tax=Peribacillus kribbensis TaxID=356658 RepID=UPI0003F990B4|nr:CD3324 family protein [Peribacillus kribbensis]
MKYVRATSVLPPSLIAEIQKYIQGETIYIPKPEGTHQKWGTNSGGRKMIDERNAAIRQAFKEGSGIGSIARDYYLSAETIRKIVYSK